MNDTLSDSPAGAPRRTLAEWLAEAYADPEAGCPPPESFLETEAASLDPEALRRLGEHADRCPACAAERDLARSFAAGAEAGDVSAEDVAFVTSRLAASSPPGRAARGAGRVVQFPQALAGRSSWAARLAAAAVVVLAAGLVLRGYYKAPPELPSPPRHGVVRGGFVETLAPVGEVATPPAELRWSPDPRATMYLADLQAVDGTVLWEGRVMPPLVRLPAEVAAGLRPGVSYQWIVVAMDAGGRRVAVSLPTRFRIRPEQEK